MGTYSDYVRQTVATCLRKEQLGLRMIARHERRRGSRYAWILLLREDSHWFGPLQLHRFAPGRVHGKRCNSFGGWNDKLWLIAREHADTMLGMYDDLHAEHAASCALRGVLRGASLQVDSLGATPRVEKFRQRIGELRGVPYVTHSACALPSVDAYFDRNSSSSSSGNSPRRCFPTTYAKGCVPEGAPAAAVSEAVAQCEHVRLPPSHFADAPCSM